MANPILRMLPLATAALLTLPAAATTPAERGKLFFNTVHGDWSCASCHTKDPMARGRHIVTGKDIAPFAPAANPKRFTDAAKVEKWFRRNCNDVLHRACTPQEKGDVVAYVTSLAPGAR
jgi:hypothetical protein